MMIFATKGNKVRRIDEASIQKFAEQGYKITNESGDVLKESIPMDLPLLKTAYIEHTRKIKMLEDEVSSLKAQLVAASKKSESSAKKSTGRPAKEKDKESLEIKAE